MPTIPPEDHSASNKLLVLRAKQQTHSIHDTVLKSSKTPGVFWVTTDFKLYDFQRRARGQPTSVEADLSQFCQQHMYGSFWHATERFIFMTLLYVVINAVDNLNNKYAVLFSFQSKTTEKWFKRIQNPFKKLMLNVK